MNRMIFGFMRGGEILWRVDGGEGDDKINGTDVEYRSVYTDIEFVQWNFCGEFVDDCGATEFNGWEFTVCVRNQIDFFSRAKILLRNSKYTLFDDLNMN